MSDGSSTTAKPFAQAGRPLCKGTFTLIDIGFIIPPMTAAAAVPALPALTWDRCPNPAEIDRLVLEFCELEAKVDRACAVAQQLDEPLEKFRERLILVAEEFGQPHAQKSKLLAGAASEIVATFGSMRSIDAAAVALADIPPVCAVNHITVRKADVTCVDPAPRLRSARIPHEYTMGFALSIIFGGLITIAIAMVVEYFRRPKLTLSVEAPPCDLTYTPQHPALNSRYLRVKLRNAALPPGLRWMQRAAALQCRGEITFHHLDGQNIFGRTMPLRWANSPQPIASQIVDTHGVVQYAILDFARMATAARMDVYPGEEEIVDIAARFDSEPDCYGWNDGAYLHNWRNPDWKLVRGRYLVKLVVTSSGHKCIGHFRLVNDVDNRTDFRLEPAKPEDDAHLS